MKITREKITIAERAAVWALVSGLVQDWNDAYIIARGEDPESLPKSWGVMASQWKQSVKIKGLFSELTAVRNNQLQAEREKARNEGILQGRKELSEEMQGIDATGIDYTKPEAQKALLNKIIAKNPTSTDALDALKVIIQGQKAEKDGAKDRQIQRFYTPLKCSSCPIRAAFAKIQEQKH